MTPAEHLRQAEALLEIARMQSDDAARATLDTKKAQAAATVVSAFAHRAAAHAAVAQAMYADGRVQP